MSIVLTALAAGATSLASTAASTAAKDLYGRLVDAVKNRVGGDEQEEIAEALSLLERKPDSGGRQTVVGEMLDDSGAADDDALLEIATLLLAELGEQGESTNVTQTATGRNVIQQVGDGSAAIVDRSKNR